MPDSTAGPSINVWVALSQPASGEPPRAGSSTPSAPHSINPAASSGNGRLRAQLGFVPTVLDNTLPSDSSARRTAGCEDISGEMVAHSTISHPPGRSQAAIRLIVSSLAGR